MNIIRICVAATARFCMSAMFLAAAVKILLNWNEMEKNLVTTLCDWQTFANFSDGVLDCFASLAPWSPLLLISSTLFLLIGGLLLLLGVKERWGSFLLILFFVPATLLYHPFWFLEGAERELQTVMFMKNLAILGGLLLILLHGGQAKSGSSTSFPSLKL